LTFEQVGFSLSNQDIRPIDGLSSLFDQMLGSVPYLLRLLPYFRWQRPRRRRQRLSRDRRCGDRLPGLWL